MTVRDDDHARPARTALRRLSHEGRRWSAGPRCIRRLKRAPAELSPTERLLDKYNAPNVVPLRAIRETAALGWGWPAVPLLGGNVLVFVPFGLLLPAIWPWLRRPWRMLLAGLSVSAAIELSQLAVSSYLGYHYRMTDVDDVLLNTCGVLLGFAGFALLERGLFRRRLAAEPVSRGQR
jgi:hypothetical protein